ncbi:hypothetical protein ACFWVC_06175, partial [Streptomyces sp. NPDC058691]
MPGEPGPTRCAAGDGRGLAVGDPVDGRHRALSTADGGRSRRVPSAARVLHSPDRGGARGTVRPATAHDLAVGDPVDGRYRALSTADGGRSRRVLPSAGEASFAASGQCLV